MSASLPGWPNERKFTWHAGEAQEIVLGPVNYAIAFAINDAGVVAGWVNNLDGQTESYIWNGASGRTPVTVPGLEGVEIRGINNQSIVAGAGLDAATGVVRSFTWSQASGATLLSQFGTGKNVAYSINDQGQVAGYAAYRHQFTFAPDQSITYSINHALLWDNGQVIDLTPDTPWSAAYDVNNHGQAIGYRMRQVPSGEGTVPSFLKTPFVWESDNGITDLPLFGDNSTALSINNDGAIVGYSGTGDFDARALLWKDGQVYDLNSLLPPDSGWLLQYGAGINDAGQIVGQGLFNGQLTAFLLTPAAPASIPEPVVGLLCAGGAALLANRRRSRPV